MSVTLRRWAVPVLGFVLLAALPYVLGTYWQQLGFRALQLLTMALAWNLLAGYTGRDRDAVLHHIHELEAIGVPPPASNTTTPSSPLRPATSAVSPRQSAPLTASRIVSASVRFTSIPYSAGRPPG